MTMSSIRPAPDYRAVFDALPLPATLVDEQGLIVDLNQASVEMAHRVGRRIRKEDRIGSPYLSFALAEEHRPRLAALIEQALREGRSEELRWRHVDAAGGVFWVGFHAAVVRDESGRPTGVVVLRQDMTERVRQETERASHERLRDALWRMSRPDDLLPLLQVLHRELVGLCPQIGACSVQLPEAGSGRWVSYHLSPDRARVVSHYPRTDGAVVTCWREQRPVYRPDLAAGDVYGEAAAIWDPERGYSPAVRSVLDVPFAHGTLAANSTRARAFTEADIDFLGSVAQLLSVGFARLQDFERLAQRNRQLEQEVTERRQAEERLARSEERYRRLVEAPQDILVVYMAPDGTYLYVGPQVEKTIGLKPADLLADRGKGRAAVHPGDLPGTQTAFRRAVETAQDQGFEFRYRHVDGTWHWAVETLTPIRDAAGRVEAVQAVLQDITEKKRSEEQLRLELQLARLRNRTVTMRSDEDWDDIVRAFDAELRQWVSYNAMSINVIDRQAGTLTAYAVGPNRGIHRNAAVPVVPEMLQAMVAVMETGEPLYRRSRRDPLFPTRPPATVQSVVDVAFVAGTVALNSLVEDGFTARDAEILQRFAEVASQGYRRLVDLRAVAEAEARFRQAQKMEAVGQLAGGVAHDFNNLLTAIVGFSELTLLEPGLSAAARTAFGEILTAARRGSGLTQQLLAFSRRQVIRPRLLDINEVLASLGKMLGRLLGEGIELVTDLEPRGARAQVDPGQLEQIVINLAVNARDAMPDGGRLTLRTSTCVVGPSHRRGAVTVAAGRYVVLTVEDTGTGMSAEVRERAFEPFYTTKETGKGTGLGLAMVYGAVKQNGGFIWLDSEPGRGTRVEIYLPAAEAPSAGSLHPQGKVSASGGSETILVVEDDAAVRDVVCRMLAHEGYAAVAAPSGEEALRLAAQHPGPIHLLLTDVIMPGMNGRELSATLTAARPELPTLYMSGYLEGAITPEELARPGVAFLSKPILPEELARQVRRLLDRAGAA
ncbi:MAG: PAS domain S-box protein [Candidatus Latescibacterota bacterium]